MGTGENLIQQRLAISAKVATLLSMLIATLVLFGWQFDIGWLKTVLPNLVTMKPVTAFSFLACGSSLWLHISGRKRGRMARAVSRGLSLVAVACGASTILEMLTGWNFPLDELLFPRALLASGIVHPGRMSSASALAFVVLGVALTLFEMRGRPRGHPWQPLSLLVILFALTQFLGYLYGVGDLYRTFGQNPMAVQTTFLFLLLGLAMFAASPDRGWLQVFTTRFAGGVVARRILPVAVLLSLLIGWMLLAGQRKGFYQTQFGMALFASLNIATFVIVVWFAARSLNAAAATLQTANENLALSERRLRLAAAGGGIGTWNWEFHSGILHSSEICRQICGLPLSGEITIEQTLSRAHHEDRGLVNEQILKALQTGGNFEVECRMVWPDGSPHWVASKGKIFADSSGRPMHMEGIVQEITGRKFAEIQMKRLAAIVEFSEDGIISHDLQGLITTWNPGAELIYGYSAEEAIGKSPVNLAAHLTANDVEEVFERALRGETTHQIETQRRTKNGKIVDISLSATPLRDAHGNIVGVSSISRDITDQRAAERQLLQAQKMEAVGQLAGGVAHDFNNLVMVINSYAQMIKDQAARPEVREYADHILRAGDKAASVTRQLLAFSRKQMQNLKLFDLNEMVRNFSKFLPRVLGEVIEMTVAVADTELFVQADQGQIEQVVMNLAVNARDAMPGGGNLTLAIESVEVGPEYCAQRGLNISQGSYAVLSVRDTGVGMDSETRTHIFEPFFTTKDIGKGTGLGLATVYGIVKQHKGLVWVYSEPGLGTEFKIYLPLCSQEAPVDAGAVPKTTVEGGSETILLVEDESSLREAISSYLTSKGYVVLNAENGAAALQTCKTWPGRIDLLITDFVMPGMRGPEVAAEILKIHPQTRVILMSGYADQHLGTDLETFKYQFLQKPLSLHALAEQIRQSLSQSRIAERV